MKTAVVKFIRKGDDGVTYSVVLTPASIYVAADGSTKTTDIDAVAYKHTGKNTAVANDGSMHLIYTRNDGSVGDTSSSGMKINDGKLIYTTIAFEYRVKGVVVATAALQINKEGQPGQTGDKGDRGPTLRGPQAWSDCAVGYSFQSGADGEEWKDVVLYNGNYYSCIKSHVKKLTNYPGGILDQNSKYWRLVDKIELVATKILLATYALVKNLGVESIDMKDAEGNVLFQAKDGNVICKTGTFENIKVQGEITAEHLNLKISTADHYDDVPELANGAICDSASGIILPELPQGTARSMRILNPLQTRTAPSNLVLKPASNKVFISKTLSVMDAVNATVTVDGYGLNAGKYVELIGIRGSYQPTNTYWLMSQMNSGLTPNY